MNYHIKEETDNYTAEEILASLINPASQDNPFIVRKPTNEIVVDYHNLNYGINGVPLRWLSLESEEDAIRYYEQNFPYIPNSALERMAKNDYLKMKNFRRKLERRTNKDKIKEAIRNRNNNRKVV